MLLCEQMRTFDLARAISVVAVLGPSACSNSSSGDGTTDATPSATTSGPIAEDTADVADESTGDSDEDTSADETGNMSGGECDYFAQDCTEGEKCVPWSELPDLIPDAIRCCPIQEPPAEAGDTCSVAGHLGSCLDNCVAGTLCLDIDGDGEGTCQEMCHGSAEDPKCTNDHEDECFIYYSGMPLCFSTCDPLLQACPPDKGCYPDAIAEGGTGFLCMPTVGDQTLGEYCWLLSGCNPGMICATPDLLPNCFGDSDDAGCCTDLCDITESPDPCADINPDLECIPWYHQGAPPPSTNLKNVGACVLPTVGG